MRLRVSLFFLSATFFFAFVIFSYVVAKEVFQQIDFDITVKLQDHIIREFDVYFSYFSFIGSAEVTVGICFIVAIFNLFKKKFFAFLGWLVIIPATIIELSGKLFLFHPGPPVLFHRSILETGLPSFYVHTNFSYPSGHMTRSIFILTIFFCLIIFGNKGLFLNQNTSFRVFNGVIVLGFGFMMTLTRVYLGEHWLSDVIGGVLLGFSSGLFAAAFIIPRKS